WKVYRVDIEPFGKDHATPGGSRDSCAEIAETIMHFRPPMGIPYEWVGIADRGKDLGDMGSSDFLGFTPAQWVEVGDPEVLRSLAPPPKEKPFALSYRHAAFLSQISPESDRLEWCLNRMRDTGMLTRRATEFERARIARRLAQSRVWVEKYATENRVKLLESL